MNVRFWLRTLLLLLALTLAVLVLTHWQRGGVAHVRYAASLAAGLAFAGYWFHDGWVHWRRSRALADAWRGPIVGLPPGLAEISGTAGAERLLTAPLSQKPCVHYRLRLEREAWAARHREWLIEKETASPAVFTIRDGTGAVAVDPAGLELEFPPQQTSDPFPPGKVPDAVRQLMISSGLLEAESSPLPAALRLAEWRVEPGATVHVLGEAAAETGGYGLRRGAGHGVFILSDRAVRRLLARQSGRALAGLLGGGALALLTAAGLLLSLGLVK